jgi:small subunit ribosomal protein S1
MNENQYQEPTQSQDEIKQEVTEAGQTVEAGPVAYSPAPPAESPATEAPTPASETGAVPAEEVPAEEAPAEAAPAEAVNEFERMMEAYGQQMPDIQIRDFVDGRIIKITENDVLVDIGTRCEGIFSVEEIKDAEGKTMFAEGDTIRVQILSSTSNDFNIRLSYRNARQQDLMRQLRKAYQEGTPVAGTITESIKGGMKVNIDGIEAFLPASQIDLRYVEKTDDYVGRREQFRIMKFFPKQNKLVVSRRVLLQEERDKVKGEVWGQLEIGRTVRGKVTRITGYGVFVDIGGIEGLIHISNLSWDKVKKPSEIVKVGQEIDTQVIELDPEKERIGLGLKQLVSDPWLTVENRYLVGQKVSGAVEKLESFGAFVKMEPGVTALIPISEMSWTKRVNHPSELLKVNDSVDTIILRVDPAERKISLSLKQVGPSPFARFTEEHQVGDILEGEVTNVMGYGAFVRLDDQVEGLLHISELSWSPVRNIDEAVQKGSKVTVKILNVNPETEKISLSARLGEPPAREDGGVDPRAQFDRPPRTDARPRREGGRRPSRREGDPDEQRYILRDAPTSATKLGELFPQELLDKMKSRKTE